MNEQIKELIEQANLSADKTYQFDPEDGFKIQEWDKIRLEKFAELIVQECAKVCADNGMRAGGASTIVGETFLDASKLIRGNFGLDIFGMY